MNDADPEALYAALIGQPALLKKVRHLEYRCVRRCLLLDAIDVNHEILLHQKRYKNSIDVNQIGSNDAGRAKNTFDGDRHWKPRTYFMGTSALALDDSDGATLGIQCDHVMSQLKPSEFHRDWQAGHTEVRLRTDGTMYAVR